MQCPFCKAQVPAASSSCPQCKTSLPPPLSGRPQGDDFGAIFTRATELWKSNLGDLALLTLVLLLVGWIPIANIGFLAGYYRAILKVLRGEGKASPADLFRAWDCFGNLLLLCILAFVAAIVLALIPLIGNLAGLALTVLITPALYAVIDRAMGAIDAVKWSIETIKQDWLNWLLAALVGGLLGGLGALALGIGLIVTLPWGFLISAVQYERHRSD